MQRLVFSLLHFWALLPCAVAQDSKPGASVHPGQPSSCIGWHTVVSGDDCETVPRMYHISKSEFLPWNPAVSEDCLKKFWLKSRHHHPVKLTSKSNRPTSSKTAITTEVISTTNTLSEITSDTLTRSIITTAINTTYSVREPISTWNITTPTTEDTWPPKATQPGQPKDCNKWHFIQGSQTCRDVLNEHAFFMTKEDCFKWNPEVHDDCSGLFVDYWYCVEVKSNSTGDFEWETSTPPFTPPPEPTSHTPTKLIPADSEFNPSPSHGPMPTDCMNYHQAEANESCRDLLKTYNYLTKEQFFKYNPVLKNNCDGLWEGKWYGIGAKCELPMPPTVTTTPSDVPSGTPKDCKAWYYSTGGETCDQLSIEFSMFSAEGFIKMNPSVFEDCSGIADDTWYCVIGPDTPTTRTTEPVSPTQPTTAMPTQSGIASDCKEYWLVSKKDTCRSITSANGVSLEKLTTWNLALGSKCSGLKPDSYVCVGI